MLPILRNKVKRIRKRRRTLLKVVSPQKKKKELVMTCWTLSLHSSESPSNQNHWNKPRTPNWICLVQGPIRAVPQQAPSISCQEPTMIRFSETHCKNSNLCLSTLISLNSCQSLADTFSTSSGTYCLNRERHYLLTSFWKQKEFYLTDLFSTSNTLLSRTYS